MVICLKGSGMQIKNTARGPIGINTVAVMMANGHRINAMVME